MDHVADSSENANKHAADHQSKHCLVGHSTLATDGLIRNKKLLVPEGSVGCNNRLNNSEVQYKFHPCNNLFCRG